MPANILLVDESTMRQPFLLEILQEAGTVIECDSLDAARSKIEAGLKIKVAVLDYRARMAPLVGLIRRTCPQATIVAYGSKRSDSPLGVDVYLHKPVLAAELRQLVARFAAL